MVAACKIVGTSNLSAPHSAVECCAVDLLLLGSKEKDCRVLPVAVFSEKKDCIPSCLPFPPP